MLQRIMDSAFDSRYMPDHLRYSHTFYTGFILHRMTKIDAILTKLVLSIWMRYNFKCLYTLRVTGRVINISVEKNENESFSFQEDDVKDFGRLENKLKKFLGL